MFISNAEKDRIKIDIMSLYTEVKRLHEDIALLNTSLANAAKPLITTDAPWGYKKDGTPCKRPGRKPKFMKVGKP
jgi:hypothetical protein